jgi:hypothetical protein
MVNRVSSGGLEVRRYFHRYTDDALDLCDALASYVPGAKVKLDEISKILGRRGNLKALAAVVSRKWFSLGKSKKSPAIAKATC